MALTTSMTRSSERSHATPVAGPHLLDAHVVFLTNFVPPYRIPLLEALQARVRRLTILVSTRMEKNRSWSGDTGHLDVRVQRTLSIDRTWRHPAGFSDQLYVHLPWSTPFDLQRLKPDIVLSGELGARSLMSAAYCLGARRPLVIWATLSERTEQGRGALRPVVRRWLLQRANRVIVNGESGARYIRRFGVPEHAVDRMAQPAVPGTGQQDAGVTRSSVVRHLIYAGQLTERKGLVPFVRALDRWCGRHPRATVELTLAGSGPLRPDLERLETSNNLVVRLVGECDADELSALYAQADAMVFPTLADEWGLVVNEALAAGLPVLGSVHSQAVEELCGDGRAGWPFDPEDRGSLEAGIDRALTSTTAELAKMRALGIDRVSVLTPDWAADRIVASLRAALVPPDPNAGGASVSSDARSVRSPSTTAGSSRP